MTTVLPMTAKVNTRLIVNTSIFSRFWSTKSLNDRFWLIWRFLMTPRVGSEIYNSLFRYELRSFS
ncbi:hypothetical protein BpHYR1_045745 [Brachionus plicatilis]|uniref:Uncharacterized protein n=1 Tax=Brachionus plicatilis TaxID=10195 RepID=A0A3M7Q5Z0_BRAPC|nr:hypothetical protein BpHYR1_045745 [Brachionus plicatilis]